MSGRKVLKAADAKKMNRLYIAEADLSRTGGVADHRIRVESSEMIGFASLVASELLSQLGRSDQALKKHLKNLSSFTRTHKMIGLRKPLLIFSVILRNRWYLLALTCQ